MSILRTSKNLTNVRNGGTPVIIRDADQMKLDILKLPVPCRDHSSKFEE